MKKIVLILALLACVDSFSQQDAMYSQYMFNPFAVNPAYAGSRNSYSAVLLHRSQWLKIPGAPNTQSFAVHAPLTKYNISWGVNMFRDQLGPQRSLMFGGTVGYHIKFKKSKLAFALRGGLISNRFDHGELNFKEDNDHFDIGNQVLTSNVPTFDFGVYYYAKKYYIGASINHITKHQIAFADVDSIDSGLALRRHLFLTGGYVFDIRPNVVLKPSIMFKGTPGAPPSVDINLSVLLFKRVWLGTSIRPANSIVFLTDVNITDFLRMGYAFDLTTSALNNVKNGGSHEIFVGFDFNLKNKHAVSPRYL